MRLYDLMLMLDPNAPDERRSEIASNVQSAIESGGTLVGAHDWGMRRIAYEIDHRADAEYKLYQFETPDGYHEKAACVVSANKCWTVPVLAGGRLYVRDESELICLDLRPANRQR